MKAITKSVLSILMCSSLFLVGCGGDEKEDSKENNEETSSEVKGDIELEIGDFTGPMSDYFIITKAIFKVNPDDAFGTKLLVEVERNSQEFEFDSEDADYCGIASGALWKWCISGSILDESGVPIDNEMDAYGYDPFESALTLGEGEKVWLEFSVRNAQDEPENAKTVSLSSSLEEDEMITSNREANANPKSNDGDCEAFLKGYEKFADDYVAIMKKYKENPSDASILQDYTRIMSDAADWSSQAGTCAADAEFASRIAAVQQKVAQAAM